jgi:hypothetical protein
LIDPNAHSIGRGKWTPSEGTKRDLDKNIELRKRVLQWYRKHKRSKEEENYRRLEAICIMQEIRSIWANDQSQSQKIDMKQETRDNRKNSNKRGTDEDEEEGDLRRSIAHIPVKMGGSPLTPEPSNSRTFLDTRKEELLIQEAAFSWSTGDSINCEHTLGVLRIFVSLLKRAVSPALKHDSNALDHPEDVLDLCRKAKGCPECSDGAWGELKSYAKRAKRQGGFL